MLHQLFQELAHLVEQGQIRKMDQVEETKKQQF